MNPEKLRVIARATAIAFKASGKPVAQIGRELGVDYVLDGSVRREGRRNRINVQLIRVSDESVLWAETYESQLDDILRLQAQLAASVARLIQVRLVSPEQVQASEGIDPRAYAAYLRGRYFWNQ